MSLLVFGADGGGTKTHGIISTLDGTILAQRTVGPGNPNVVGFDAATKNLYELVTTCCQDAGCAVSDLRIILFGLAGAGREESRTKLTQGVNTLAGTSLPLVIETDARIGLEGAFEGAPGVIIIAGTGSVVIGKNAHQDIVMLGGWGRAFGDEGSGYYLGLEALKSLALHFDGRGGSPLLAELVIKEFGLNSRDRLIASVYQEKLEMSLVAPLVLQAAEQNDEVALRILHAGATELAGQARAVVERIKPEMRIGMAFFGGLIDKPTIYADILKKKVNEMIPAGEVKLPARTPAEGAILMAREFARKQ